MGGDGGEAGGRLLGQHRGGRGGGAVAEVGGGGVAVGAAGARVAAVHAVQTAVGGKDVS